MDNDRKLALRNDSSAAGRTVKLEIVRPQLWLDDESLSDVIRRLGYTHRISPLGHTYLSGDREVFSTTRSNAYELAVLWLIRTRQVVLSPRLERCVRGYASYGLGAEVNEALEQAVRS